MSRYRLHPTPAQQAILRDHCGHARYVWNLAVEQHSHWRPGRRKAPGYLEQCRQLTQARAENPDRKSTRLNSSHLGISYAVFCLKKTKKNSTIVKGPDTRSFSRCGSWSRDDT